MTIYILDIFKALKKFIVSSWTSATNGASGEMLWKKSPAPWVLTEKYNQNSSRLKLYFLLSQRGILMQAQENLSTPKIPEQVCSEAIKQSKAKNVIIIIIITT